MKFVLFNFSVIAALFFLFDPDRAELHALADRAYETVGLARDTAEKAVEKVEQPAEVLAAPVSVEPQAKPVAAVPEKNDIADPKAEAPKIAAASPEILDPAVAKRRAEVLGIDAPQATNGQANDKLMTPQQRRRELFTLAEEMELFYVRRLSR